MPFTERAVPVARLEQVSYLYPHAGTPALKDISLEVRPGEFLGLIGPTGAGKTTLCLTFNGIVPQFYGGRFFGRATVAGLDTLEHPSSALARHVGMVFEDPETQLTATSVENEIAFALENLSVPREEMRARISRVLEAVRLEGLEHRQPHELSGGQKQRLAIAAALALQPELLVLDEPTSQLDPVGAQEVFATVRELNRALGMTIVMAGHASEELAEFADRIALLSAGALAAIGTPDEICAQVELLRAHHLRPPQVATTFYLIGQTGDEPSRIPVRLEEGKTALHRLVATSGVNPPARLPHPPAGEGPPLLSIQNLTYKYGDGTLALRDISLDIRQGEYVLVIGQNGAGKSTLVKHFLRLLEPTSGSVRVTGTNTRAFRVSELARRIGYVAQNPDQQLFNATVWDEVAFALRNLGYSPEEVATRTQESLESLGLLARRAAHPLSLPRGERARVVIAAVLAMRPEVIIFDEPTTGQDACGARAILDVSKRLHELGKTLIVITHQLYLMPEYAERVLVMGKGTLLLDAPIREAYHRVALLRSTYLVPPQAVLLARELPGEPGREFPLLTPAEVAGCLARVPGGADA